MKNFFKVTVIAALFMTIPAFLPLVNANNHLPLENEKPEWITNLTVVQSGSGQITATWNTDCVEWVCQASIFDITNGWPYTPIITLVPANSPFTYGGLTVGRTYRVAITDCNSTFERTIKIMF